ncbi:hypothetical protein FACS189419_01150 [Planctomycetales bacterium]|nr:hypothetical protein FACS189419_01150 [Planctomycetales bacterium]
MLPVFGVVILKKISYNEKQLGTVEGFIRNVYHGVLVKMRSYFVLFLSFLCLSYNLNGEDVLVVQPSGIPVEMPSAIQQLGVLVPPGIDNLPNVPADKGMLLRMQKQLTFELQQTQRTLGFIDPNDKQLRTTLENQQADLTKQIKDIEKQLTAQTPSAAIPQFSGAAPDASAFQPPFPPQVPSYGMAVQQMLPPSPNSTLQPVTPSYSPPEHIPSNYTPWQPQSSKELTELKASVNSLRSEVSELKATIKALETQIQLLNRTILLSEKVKE